MTFARKVGTVRDYSGNAPSTFDSINHAYGSRGSFASKNNDATDGLNSAAIGDIWVINSIGKYPNSVEQRMRKPSFVVSQMWSSLEVTRAFRSAGIPYRKTIRA